MDARQFLAGSIAGGAGQIVGHPLDTIKVRLQTSAVGALGKAGGGVQRSVSASSDLSAFSCASQTFKEGGARAFFRGLSLPLLSKSFEQCIAFGIRGAADTALHNFGFRDGSRLRAGLAGAAAGATTSLLLTPVYLIKVQLQVTARDGAGGIAGPVAAVRRTVATLGPAGLYTGALPILLGTSVGYAFRFATYEQTVDAMRAQGFGDSSATIVGGGLAGMATWASHYPLDLVSSRMQAAVVVVAADRERSSCCKSGVQMMGMMDHFRTVHREQGLKGFFRGLGPCLLRAFPVNATIFLTYESCLSLANNL